LSNFTTQAGDAAISKGWQHSFRAWQLQDTLSVKGFHHVLDPIDCDLLLEVSLVFNPSFLAGIEGEESDPWIRSGTSVLIANLLLVTAPSQPHHLLGVLFVKAFRVLL
jgi:hypothetical protein